MPDIDWINFMAITTILIFFIASLIWLILLTLFESKKR